MPEIISKTAWKASTSPSVSGFLSSRCLLSLSDSVPGAALGRGRFLVAPRPRGRSELRSPNLDGAAAGAAGTPCPEGSPREPRGARVALPGGRGPRALPVTGGTGRGNRAVRGRAPGYGERDPQRRKDAPEEFRGPARHPAFAKHRSQFLFLEKPAREFKSMGFVFRFFCGFGFF